MCGRYSIIAKAEKLSKRFKVDVPDPYTPKYNAAPTQLLPVITNENPDGISFFYWGLIPNWANNKSISSKLINARAESLREKASFKNSFKRKRCIIPADGFYEWKQLGKKSKIPYRFILNNEELFGFAGLWDEYEDENENIIHTFTIITTTANSLVSEIHDRMPLILNPEKEAAWLSNETTDEELLKMMLPYDSNKMDLYTVSSLINSPANEGPRLIEPAPAVDQFGNYTLFG
jgi:putative SOS response-associated peptidase YedK